MELFYGNQHLLPLHSVTQQEDSGASALPTISTLVQVPAICSPLNDQLYQNLKQQIDPLVNNSRVDLYKQVTEYVGNSLLDAQV